MSIMNNLIHHLYEQKDQTYYINIMKIEKDQILLWTLFEQIGYTLFTFLDFYV